MPHVAKLVGGSRNCTQAFSFTDTGYLLDPLFILCPGGRDMTSAVGGRHTAPGEAVQG